MSKNPLWKLYSGLTPEERVRAMFAARARGDEQELEALMNTSQKVGYSVRDGFFLFEAVNTCALCHMVEIYQKGCTFLIGQAALHTYDDQGKEDKFNSVYEGMRAIALNILTIDAAWKAFCDEIGVDPYVVLKGLPGAESNDKLATLPLLVSSAKVFYTEEINPEQVKIVLDGYKAIYEAGKK